MICSLPFLIFEKKSTYVNFVKCIEILSRLKVYCLVYPYICLYAVLFFLYLLEKRRRARKKRTTYIVQGSIRTIINRTRKFKSASVKKEKGERERKMQVRRDDRLYSGNLSLYPHASLTYGVSRDAYICVPASSILGIYNFSFYTFNLDRFTCREITSHSIQIIRVL